jgi:hypothetical protein
LRRAGSPDYPNAKVLLERCILNQDHVTAAVKAALDAKPGAVGTTLPKPPGVLIYKVMDRIFAILETRAKRKKLKKKKKK